MQLLDWMLVAASLLIVLGIGIYTQFYMRSVADFMSAGRVARRYLLAVGKGEQSAGAVVFVFTFEQINHSGFPYQWWQWLQQPILLVAAIFGFVIYRYRETRALTLGQFFEIRYSRNLRLFTGFLGFFAGLLNFGIIPVIGARAMVYLLGLPTGLHLGEVGVPTYVVLMAVFLAVNLFVTLSGGLITIMMTNCAEGIISQILYLVLIIGLMSMFPWSQIASTLYDRPANQSFLNPMDSFATRDFNFWTVLMGIAGGIYGTMAWQNQSAYQSAPLTPHEGVMGGLLGRWRGIGQTALVTLLCICAMTYLHDPAYASGAAQVHLEQARIASAQVQEQMEIPLAITHLLPTGLRGALCAILLLGIFGGDSTHLHSWGSLFIQDVILPLRRRPFTQAQHIRLLRGSIAGVALFVFFFGIYFPLNDYIGMWFTVTMSIYIAGAGAAIIGGLYWKKGTTAAAWAAMLTGSSLSLIGITLQSFYGRAFPLNGVQISFFTMLVTLTVYIVVSLLTCRESFNMDRMLHRGLYAKAGPDAEPTRAAAKSGRFTWGSLIGFDEKFTTGDKWIAGGLFAWMMVFFGFTVFGTLWNVLQPWPLWVWSAFWHATAVIVPAVVALITGVWFTWGGIRDALDLFRRLRGEKVNVMDSGFVVDHQNLDERSESRPPPPKGDGQSLATGEKRRP